MNSLRKIFLIGLSLFLSETFTFGHLCHDPFRPRERLLLIPDKELVKIEKSGEFRIYVENTFTSTLREVRLFVESPAFDINIEPKVLNQLIPGERSFFLIRLKLREDFLPGDYPLRISVKARSAELRPSIEKIEVIAEEKKSLQPSDEEIKPKKIEPSEEPSEVVVKVEKLPFWEKPSFYLILILFFLGILIFRKIKTW